MTRASTSDIHEWSAVQIAKAVRRGVVSCTEVIEATLARIDEVNPALNAYCFVGSESARSAAQELDDRLRRGENPGPLAGVPISIKDNIETTDMPTTHGSQIFAANRPSSDAVCVERLRAAGAVIIGKTNLAEFAAKSTADSPLHGTTLNPWDQRRGTGGSSGGSAAAVAAALGPVSVGNDQAGSVRIPAALCGVVGFKPTAGRIPFAPAEDPWDHIFHVGLLARSAADIDLLLRVTRGADPRDPASLPELAEDWDVPLSAAAVRWRLAYAPSVGMGLCSSEVQEAVGAAAAMLDGVGVVSAVDVSLADAEIAYSTLVPFRRAAAMGHHLDDWRNEMDPSVADYIESGMRITPKEYGEANRSRTRLLAAVEAVLQSHDLLVTPTVGATAVQADLPFPASIDGAPLRSWRDWIPFTYPFNLTGHPAVSVPVGLSVDGLPIGLQIVGRRFSDRSVLAAAQFLIKRIHGKDLVPVAPVGAVENNKKEGQK